MTCKPNLLFISGCIPGSWAGGTPMRAGAQITALSEFFDVTLAIVGDHRGEAEVRSRLSSDLRVACISVIVVNEDTLINRLYRRTRWQWVRLFLESISPTPLPVAPCLPAIGKLAKVLAGHRFDVVHCFRLYTGVLRPLKRHGIAYGRSVLDLDDHESKTCFRQVTYIRALFGRMPAVVCWLQGVKWAILERLRIPSFDDVLVCSEIDRDRLRRSFPLKRWHVVPNTIAAPPAFGAARKEEFTLFFVATFTYPPSIDAAVFFCGQVLPIFRRLMRAPIRVLLVGRSASRELARLGAPEDVEIISDPPDLTPYYAQADLAVIPLRAGGGTRIKILEAFSYGVPVVSTTIGAEGLDVTPDVDILIADNPDVFAEQCYRIWEDELLRRRIAAAGFALWRSRYSQAALRVALSAVYRTDERDQEFDAAK